MTAIKQNNCEAIPENTKCLSPEPLRPQNRFLHTENETPSRGVDPAVPLESLPAAGILAGAKGYPRCPDAAISAAGVLAEMGGGAWGPPCLSPHVRRRIDELRN